MKKILLSGLLLLATVGLFANGNNEASSEGEVITLEVWDIMVTADEERAIKPIVEEWNATHPNIQVVRDSLKDDAHRTRVTTAIAANEAPDLFYGWAGGMVKPYIEAGKLLDINDYLSQETKDALIGGADTYFKVDGGLYGLPYGMWSGHLFVNRELFEQVGLEYPETTDDLLNCVKVFRENGIAPIATAAESWVAMFYQNALAAKTAGADQVNKALMGEASYNSEDFLQASEILDELLKAEAFQHGFMGMDFDEAQNMFITGQTAMFYQGNWISGSAEMDSATTVAGKIDAIHFPYVKGKEQYRYDGLGGSVDGFFISNDTPHKEEAVMFLEYLVQEMSLRSAMEGQALPVFKADIDVSKLDRVAQQILKLNEEATGFTLAWDTFLAGEDQQLHLDSVMEVFAGVMTPQEFVDTMQTINEM